MATLSQGFIASPFFGPSVLGFMVSRTSWRWIYGVGVIYQGLVVILVRSLALVWYICEADIQMQIALFMRLVPCTRIIGRNQANALSMQRNNV